MGHQRSENQFRSSIDPASLLRERQVLRLLPISKSSWWAGVRAGRFPKPLKLGPNTTAWRASDILALIESLASCPTPTPGNRCANNVAASHARGTVRS